MPAAPTITFNEHKPQVDGRSDFLKKLYKAGGHAARGRVNACQFGCREKDLDENGFCKHLVGFTSDGKNFEPMIKETKRDGSGNLIATGRKIVRPKQQQTSEVVEYDPETGPVKVPVLEKVLEKVRKGDVLVWISTCARVYRDVEKLGERPTLSVEAREMSPEEQEAAVKMQLDAKAAGGVVKAPETPAVNIEVVDYDDEADA
jgi:hypothetical protein